jgi:two-component system response regulator AtoC
MNNPRILIIDDDRRMLEHLTVMFKKRGVDAIASDDPREALILINENDYDLVITDMKMPGPDGLKVLEYCKQAWPDMPVVMITGYGTVGSAVEAMKTGAYDYIEKPFDPEELYFIAKRAIEFYRLMRKNRELEQRLGIIDTERLVGSSEAINRVKKLIKQVAPFDITVLIQGETGTGKELVARLIHEKSLRSDRVFLPVNCGALPENLLESELFGYEKGAFTGADKQKKGLIEAAEGGTLFLDEINSMPPALQVKLLRFLQDKRFLRVGGVKEIEVDIRVICSTNTDLEVEVQRGGFRKDLFYRLNSFTIKIPPLRQRRDDIPELACYFLEKHSRKHGKKIKGISKDVLQIFRSYPWPGNVRELENTIERALIIEETDYITPASLPEQFHTVKHDPLEFIGSLSIEDMEEILIKKTLKDTGGNRTRAAQLLGIDASTLWRKMKKYGIH